MIERLGLVAVLAGAFAVVALVRPRLIPPVLIVSYTLLRPVVLVTVGDREIFPFHVAISVALVALFVRLAVDRNSNSRIVSKDMRRFALWYVGFLSIIALGFFRGVAAPFGLDVFANYLTSFALVWVVALSIRSDKDMWSAAVTLFAVTVIGAFLGILQLTYSEGVSLAHLLGTLDERSSGAVGYGTRNFSFGLDMLVGTVPLAALWIHRQRERGTAEARRFGLGAVVGAAAIVLSRSRSTWLGLLGALAYMTWSSGLRAKLRRSVGLVLIFIGGLVVAYVAYQPVREQLEVVFGGRYDEDFGYLSRIELIRGGLKLLSTDPLWGIGVGRFEIDVAPLLPRFVSEQFTVPHNVFLGLLVELGVFGLLFYLGALWTAFRAGRVRGAAFEQPREFALRVGLRAALVGHLIDSLFHNYFFDNHLWLLCGFLLAVSRLERIKARHHAPSLSDDSHVALARVNS